MNFLEQLTCMKLNQRLLHNTHLLSCHGFNVSTISCEIHLMLTQSVAHAESQWCEFQSKEG